MRSTHHLTFVSLFVGAATLLPSALTAQSHATTLVVRGCLQAAPISSLRTTRTTPPVLRHDANGVYAFEAESTAIVRDWVLESSIPGHSGSGYLRWSGRNLFNTSGRGVLTYFLWCEQPQRFRLQMHNRHDHRDPSEENDCWMSINGASWRKIYSNDNRNAGVWNWHTRVDPGHGFYEFNLVQGMNELRISGRSQNFKLDRIHVFPRGNGRMEDLTMARSVRMGQRPVIGTTVDVEIGDPLDQAGLTHGSTTAFLMLSASPSATLPCGTRMPGMGKAGGPGELLLGVTPSPVILPAGPWQGPTSPAVLSLPIPGRRALIGTTIHTQGLLLDASGATTRTVLTRGLDLTIGDA